MNKIYVTPKPGLRVRREDGQLLDAKGEQVERNTYWLRRIKDGDVLTAQQKAKSKALTTETTEATEDTEKKQGKNQKNP
jgi:thiamine kinase-like enzyme